MARCRTIRMNLTDRISSWLLLIGGFNWLPAGVSLLFGGQGNDFIRLIFGDGILSGIVFTLVGVSAVYFFVRAMTKFK